MTTYFFNSLKINRFVITNVHNLSYPNSCCYHNQTSKAGSQREIFATTGLSQTSQKCSRLRIKVGLQYLNHTCKIMSCLYYVSLTESCKSLLWGIHIQCQSTFDSVTATSSQEGRWIIWPEWRCCMKRTT